MKSKQVMSLIIGTVALFLATGFWVLGLYGTAGNPSLALHLEIASEEPTALSRLRYEVYLYLGADPNRRFIEMDGMTSLDVAVEKKNLYAIVKLSPLVEDSTFASAVSLACEKRDEVVIQRILQSRGSEAIQSSCSNLDRL
ncbi:hypothetical protein Rhein_3200 [Rheinheimera sp. A13L]|uniref:hypothetical protein n=1 Tax=Rheinheimera sp. A13L TaxID=506534 RepID=UPI00021256B3|nr:hypothetical protein [Rheinheimera sp. A13L]EGM76704.1 hypothetical protein Rhein_3200 [Rheinheimera sp. A13L]